MLANELVLISLKCSSIITIIARISLISLAGGAFGAEAGALGSWGGALSGRVIDECSWT